MNRLGSALTAQWWGCCPPCIWEMNNWCACLPWLFLSSLMLPFSWGLAEVRRYLYMKNLECVFCLSFLLRSHFHHFFLFVLPHLSIRLVCHLPAVLTCRCCFPALREAKLPDFCGGNFYFYFLPCSALGPFFWWRGLCVLLAGTSVLLPSQPITQLCTRTCGRTNVRKQQDIS